MHDSHVWVANYLFMDGIKRLASQHGSEEARSSVLKTPYPSATYCNLARGFNKVRYPSRYPAEPVTVLSRAQNLANSDTK
jgi:hypothetical protein